MDEEIIIEEGTIETFIQIICASYSNIIKNSFFQKYLNYFSTVFRSFQQLNNILVSKKNVAHHYDLNEELYRLFLDEDMQYSCGYYHNDNISLNQAQKDKKNHIIKKLKIEKDMTVLDIGCGWGSSTFHLSKFSN